MAEKKSLYLEHTSVPAPKTIGEISALLVSAGAIKIQTTFHEGEPAGIRWSMKLYGREVWFQMPVKVDAVFKILNGKRKSLRGVNAADQHIRARRIAWRQLLAWTQIQIAMVQLEQAEYGQVFFPYLVENDRTAWDIFKTTQFPQIEAPKQ